MATRVPDDEMRREIFKIERPQMVNYCRKCGSYNCSRCNAEKCASCGCTDWDK